MALGLGLNSSDGTPSELAKWVVFCSLVWTSVPFGVMLTVFPTVLGEAYGHVNFVCPPPSWLEVCVCVSECVCVCVSVCECL